MSSIARIFIVLNLLLAALCLGWASNHLSSAQNWKEKHDALTTTTQDEIEAKMAELAGLNVEVNTVKGSVNRLRTERETLFTQNERNKADLESARASNITNNETLTGINQSLSQMEQGRNEAQSRFEQAVSELDTAKEERRTAQDAAEAAGDGQRQAEEALAAANRNIVDLETQVTTLAKDLEKVTTTLDVAIAKFKINPEDIMVQPDIAGAVVTVSDKIKPGLVGINRGRADGVKRGFIFQLYNGNQFKGTARVETVEDNTCFAVIESTYMDRVVTQGDKATTQL